VSIVGSRQTSADIQKLANPYTYEVPNSADQKPSLGADSVPQARNNRKNLFGNLPIDHIIVLTAQQVVPKPRRMRHRRINIAKLPPL
jgi:hypothetical protein